jgi:hypothetical protein
MRSVEPRTVAALVLFGLFAACASSGPKPMLPKFKTADQDVFGGWIVAVPVEAKAPRIAGELIAVEPERLVILAASGAVRVEKRAVQSATLALYDPKSLLGNVGSGMLFSLLTNGILSVPTIGLWGVAGGMALRDVSVAAKVNYPDATWDALGKGARFPQGLPEGFDIQKLEPRMPPGSAPPH